MATVRIKAPYEKKRLTLVQWFKAKAKARELRRRWKNDPEFRDRVKNAVQEQAPKFIQERTPSSSRPANKNK